MGAAAAVVVAANAGLRDGGAIFGVCGMAVCVIWAALVVAEEEGEPAVQAGQLLSLQLRHGLTEHTA